MIITYLRSLFARFVRCAETEREQELASHIDMRADHLERIGLTRAEAERRARIEFGGHERLKEECREAIAGHDGRTRTVSVAHARHEQRSLSSVP